MRKKTLRGVADARTVKGSYETLEHTADIGILATAKTLEDLFAVTACAMFDLMIDISGVKPVHKAEVSLTGESLEELLVTWLNELIFRAEVSGMFFSKFEVESVAERALTATVWGEPYRAERHLVGQTVKAATYHELEVSGSGENWSAKVIFDV